MKTQMLLVIIHTSKEISGLSFHNRSYLASFRIISESLAPRAPVFNTGDTKATLVTAEFPWIGFFFGYFNIRRKRFE